MIKIFQKLNQLYTIILVFLIFNITLSAQPQFNYFPVPFEGDQGVLKNAMAGGINSGQFFNVDLNNDGKQDLCIFDRSGRKVFTFLNGGTSDQVDFNYAPEYERVFPEILNWALSADYNCDGRIDLFVSAPGGIAVYRNDIASNPLGIGFTLVEDLIYTQGNSYVNLYVSAVDIPTLADVDGDGDIDILTFGITGSTMEFHKNLSKENFGHCDSLKFVRETQCWGNFSENAFNSEITTGVSCMTSGGGEYDEVRGARHAGSTVLALDMDGDGDQDVLLGDISSNNIVYLRNGGNSTTANIDKVEYNFPVLSTPVNIPIFPAGFYLDMDNDGLKDLIFSTNIGNSSESKKGVWYYKNTGNQTQASFSYSSNSFQDQMVDVGSDANAVFFDYDSDGKKDIVIGNYAYNTSGGEFVGTLSLYQNVGTTTSPSYKLVDEDFGNISSTKLESVYPSFGDLDNDGDEDMLVGEYNGLLHYYENTAGSGNPAAYTLKLPNFQSIDVGQFAAPFLVDMNNDGKLDLIIGNRTGKLYYYENNSVGTTLTFAQISNNFGGVNVAQAGYITGYSAPFYGRIDSSSTKYLIVGSERGMIYLYKDIDQNMTGTFPLVDSMYSSIRPGQRSTVSCADITGDGKPELLVGNSRGGITLFQGGDNITFSINKPSLTPKISVSTLISNGRIQVEFSDISSLKNIQFKLYDLTGKLLLSSSLSPIKFQTIELGHGISPGMYITQFYLNGFGIESQKIINTGF